MGHLKTLSQRKKGDHVCLNTKIGKFLTFKMLASKKIGIHASMETKIGKTSLETKNGKTLTFKTFVFLNALPSLTPQ